MIAGMTTAASRADSSRTAAEANENRASRTVVPMMTRLDAHAGTITRTTMSNTASTSAVTRTSRSPRRRPSRVVRDSRS